MAVLLMFICRVRNLFEDFEWTSCTDDGPARSRAAAASWYVSELQYGRTKCSGCYLCNKFQSI